MAFFWFAQNCALMNCCIRDQVLTEQFPSRPRGGKAPWMLSQFCMPVQVVGPNSPSAFSNGRAPLASM